MRTPQQTIAATGGPHAAAPDGAPKRPGQLTEACDCAESGLVRVVPSFEPPERRNSRTKSSTDSVSPRRAGSMLAASNRFADSFPEPAHSANALRDVLRRWANA